MAKGYRQGRLGEEIKKIISGMLVNGIKDPTLVENMVSVSAVDVSGDGSYATVYVSVLGMGSNGFATREQKEEVIKAFGRAKGLLKREIGKKIKLRHIPELIFKIDDALEYGLHMSAVIASLGIENYKNDDEEEAGSSEIDDIMKDL